MAEESPVQMQTIIEGWCGKQGFHFPTWKVRWFVLEKKITAGDSDDVVDARNYFKTSSDSYERAHNYNVKTDKVNLVLTYYTDETKAEVKEVFKFDEDTYWVIQKARVTSPKFQGGQIDSIHLFCKGSRGAHKLIFIPFWGFVEPTFNLLCQPWVLCMEFGKPRAYDGEHDTYYHDFITVQEDEFGRQQKDLDEKLAIFKAIFDDKLIFKDMKANPIFGLKVMVPIKFFNMNAQEDNLKKDKEDAEEASQQQLEWQMKFTKKLKELQVQKATAGSRVLWLKLCKQAAYRNLKFEEWMEVKDKDDNMDSIPANLR